MADTPVSDTVPLKAVAPSRRSSSYDGTISWEITTRSASVEGLDFGGAQGATVDPDVVYLALHQTLEAIWLGRACADRPRRIDIRRGRR